MQVVVHFYKYLRQSDSGKCFITSIVKQKLQKLVFKMRCFALAFSVDHDIRCFHSGTLGFKPHGQFGHWLRCRFMRSMGEALSGLWLPHD